MVTKAHKFRITDEKWEQFKKQCTIDGTDCSHKIRDMITEYINNVTIDNTETINKIENIYNRAGFVTEPALRRLTNGQSEFENIVQYCDTNKIPIRRVYDEPCRIHNFCNDYDVKVID